MAKKDKQKKEGELNLNDVQKRMDKYYKARESEKKGKTLVLSLIGTSVFILLMLLIIVLKMNGVGKTIVFTTDDSGNISTSVADSDEVSGQNLAEVIANTLAD